MKITIAIPTYNRGHRALKTVKELLKFDYDASSLEIVVSNNGSTLHAEEYEELSLIQDDRLVYHRFDENMGFLVNLNQVMKMSTGDYCMLLSDEDTVDPIVFDYYVDQIRVHPDVHMIRPASDVQYYGLCYRYGTTDKDAIDFGFVADNYISGTIFDRRILTDEVIDSYYDRYKDVRAYQDYPHLFLGAELLIHGGYYRDSYALIHEGEPEKDDTLDQEHKEVQIQHYGTFEKRLEQMDGVITLINDLNTNPARRFQMMQIICLKTAYLVELVRGEYLKIGEDWNKVLDHEKKEMQRMVRKTNVPLREEDWDMVDAFISEVVEEYR